MKQPQMHCGCRVRTIDLEVSKVPTECVSGAVRSDDLVAKGRRPLLQSQTKGVNDMRSCSSKTLL